MKAENVNESSGNRRIQTNLNQSLLKAIEDTGRKKKRLRLQRGFSMSE